MSICNEPLLAVPHIQCGNSASEISIHWKQDTQTENTLNKYSCGNIFKKEINEISTTMYNYPTKVNHYCCT